MVKKKQEDEFSIDLSSVKKFFNKFNWNNKAIIIIALILIPIFFAIFFRSYSYDLPITHQWAENTVYNSIRGSIQEQVNKQYPNLPLKDKNDIISEDFNNFIKTNNAAITTQIDSLALNFKERLQDDTGQTYLLAIDPYVYYRYTKNYVESGQFGDTFVDERDYELLTSAPLGSFYGSSLHPYVEVYFHKLMSIFSNNSVMKNVFFIPILLSALSVIPAFFIARKRAGNLAGFIAAMIIGIHSAFVGRTAGGFADTDAYNVLFPLFIAWLFIEGFETMNFKKKVFLFLGAGFLTGLYSFAWSGWWYIFDFLVLSVVAYGLFQITKTLVQEKSVMKIWNAKFKNAVYTFGMFIVSSAVFVSLFHNFKVFTGFITGPLNFQILKTAAHSTLWPNVYTTVAELNPASLSSAIGSMGGKFLFFIAALGILATLLRYKDLKRNDWIILGFGTAIYLVLLTPALLTKTSPMIYAILFILPVFLALFVFLREKQTDVDIKYALFLAIWFMGTIYATSKGIRFTLLMVPAFGIALGIAFASFQKNICVWLSKEFKSSQKWISAALIIVILMLLFVPFNIKSSSGKTSYVSPMKMAHITATGEVPSMNDAWWNSLTGIKEGLPEGTIITSWWDFGHWFKAIAERPVTFDGGSQNRPQAHWVGKILMNSNEDEAIGILRMLDCGANTAFDEVNKKYQDTEISVNVIYEIVNKNKEDANEYLLSLGYTDSEVKTILEKTHCNPPDAVFITSGDMVGKAGVWSHFGSWDFDRAYVYKNLRNQPLEQATQIMMDRFGYSEEEAANIYFEAQALSSDEEANSWIATWPNYVSGIRDCKGDNLSVSCNLGISIGQNNAGQRVVISEIKINLSDKSNSRFILSFIDSTTGALLGTQEAKPSALIFDNERIEMNVSDFDLDVTYDSELNKAIVTHPALSQALFTKLFFFEGKNTEYFERFSDVQSINGDRIIVWKVNWEGTS